MSNWTYVNTLSVNSAQGVLLCWLQANSPALLLVRGKVYHLYERGGG